MNHKNIKSRKNQIPVVCLKIEISATEILRENNQPKSDMTFRILLCDKSTSAAHCICRRNDTLHRRDNKHNGQILYRTPKKFCQKQTLLQSMPEDVKDWSRYLTAVL